MAALASQVDMSWWKWFVGSLNGLIGAASLLRHVLALPVLQGADIAMRFAVAAVPLLGYIVGILPIASAVVGFVCARKCPEQTPLALAPYPCCCQALCTNAQQSCCPDRVQGGCYQYWLAMSAGSSTRQQRCACDLPTGDIAHAVYGYRRHTCSDTHTHPAVLHHVLHITRLCNARALCSAERNFDLQWQPLLQQVCAERSPPAIGLDKYVILPAFQ
jgi:hypothetical protein